MKKVKNRKINYKLIIKIEKLILIILLVIGVFQFVKIPSSVKEAFALATTKKPETFTELYFEDHTNLPKTIKLYEFYSFDFTVHSLEYKDTDYSYIVYLQRENQKIILDQGKFNLKNNEYKSIKEDFGPLKHLRAKIVVELVNKNQQIAFWIGEE